MRWGKLIPTQKNTEWTDMCGARYVIIDQLRRKLGLTELWNSNGRIINPAAFAKATRFVDQNQSQCLLAFGFAGTVKKILFSWGGHKLKVIQRVRKREKKNGSHTVPPCATGVLLPTVLHSRILLRMSGQNRLAVRTVRGERRTPRPAVRVDESIRQLESPPWNLLRYCHVPA